MHFVVWVIVLIIIVILLYLIKNRFYDIQFTWFNQPTKEIEKFTNDVSQFNKTPIDQIFTITNKNDIHAIITKAQKYNKQISIHGTKHTMGGHTINKNGYIINTSKFNKVLQFNSKKKEIIVQPGIIWSDLILYLDPYGLSPMTLQSYSSFSVGGTISVNAHGITNDYGIYKSVIELGIINSINQELTCSRNQNQELFSLVIGGYGLFGIITWVKLKLVNNVKLVTEYVKLNAFNFNDKYQQILKDPSINIKLARININNMNDISLYIFRESKKSNKLVISNVHTKNPEMSKVSQFLYKWIFPSPVFQEIRYDIENITKNPIDIGNKNERNLILYESANPVTQLYSPIIDLNATHILQEFFIPLTGFLDFMNYLKQVFLTHKFKYVTLLNITIRYVFKDTTTFLNYAKTDMYAFVLYYRLPRKLICDRELHIIHNLLTTKTLALDGTFYLPYRHHYTKEQLQTSYPQIKKFFELKQEYDPNNLFSNMWYKEYLLIK